MTTPVPPEAPPRAAFETIWLLHLHEIVNEALVGLRLVNLLCKDDATKRAIVNGDPAARREVLKAFLRLIALRRRITEELEPPPVRFRSGLRLMKLACGSLEAAAIAFEEGTGATIDFDRLDDVTKHLEATGRFLDAITQPMAEPEPTAPAPARKPRRRVNRAAAVD